MNHDALTFRLGLLSSWLLLCAVGCESDINAAPTAHTSAQTQTSALTSQADEEATQEALFEEAAKRAETKRNRVALAVDWQEAQNAKINPVPLSSAQQSRIATVDVPVLLSTQNELLQEAFITSGPGWYTASMKVEGLTVVIEGNSQGFLRPELVDEIGPDGLGKDPVFMRTHMIHSVSFSRFGAHYMLDLECARPASDARCADTKHVASILQSLAMMGGAP